MARSIHDFGANMNKGKVSFYADALKPADNLPDGVAGKLKDQGFKVYTGTKCVDKRHVAKIAGYKPTFIAIDEVADIPEDTWRRFAELREERFEKDYLTAFSSMGGAMSSTATSTQDTAMSIDKLAEAMRQIRASGQPYDTDDHFRDAYGYLSQGATGYTQSSRQFGKTAYAEEARLRAQQAERNRKAQQEIDDLAKALAEQESVHSNVANFPGGGSF